MPPVRTILFGAVIVALVALLAISTDLMAPALPTIGRALAADQATVQLSMSLFVAGFAVAQLVCGPLSDRFGRRPVLLGGVALYMAASLGCAMADSIGWLVAFRFVQALGACTGPVIGRAMVRDIYGREGAARALAWVGAAMGFVPAVAPIAGAWLLVLAGWRSIFIFLAIFSGLALIGVIFVLTETNRWRDTGALTPGRLYGDYRAMLGRRDYLGYSLAVAFIYSALFMFLSGSGYVLIGELGMPVEHFGYWFAALAGGYVVGTLIAGRLTMRLGIDRMIRAGTVIGLAGGGLLAALAWSGVAAVPAVIGPMCIQMVGMGIILPNAMAGAIGPWQERAGAASALLGFVQLAIAAVVGAVVGAVFGWSQMTLAGAVLVLCLLAFLAVRLLLPARRSYTNRS